MQFRSPHTPPPGDGAQAAPRGALSKKLVWLIPVVVIALLTIFFAAIFRWSTGLRPRFGEVLPGALTAAVGWSIFSWAFSAWVSATGSYGTYGSLVTVVVVMLWLYYCQYILLLSACLNRALPKFRRRGETEPASEPEPSEE